MNYSLLGRKVGMTQVYDEDNQLVPVTVIEAGPCPVVQVKNHETDGYDAIQIGFGSRKPKNTSKAQLSRFKKAGLEPVRSLREVRGKADDVEVGQMLTVDGFKDVPKVDVVGLTKGAGFQGVMHRWGMAGQPASHGHMTHRRPGSIGFCQNPGHVVKNKKMPGREGQERRTVQNLRVVKVIAEKNLILVKGSIPGANGDEVLVRTAIKTRKSA